MAIQKYLMKLYDLLSTHSAWKDIGISTHTKMMLETFMYAKCYHCIQPILIQATIETDDDIGYDDCDDNNNDNVEKKEKNNKDKAVLVFDDEELMNKKLEFLQ